MEPISISFSDAKDNVINLSMIVYEVTNREIVGGKQMKATLRCCNEDVTNAAGILISTQFEDKNITDIVKDPLVNPLTVRFQLSRQINVLINLHSSLTIGILSKLFSG